MVHRSRCGAAVGVVKYSLESGVEVHEEPVHVIRVESTNGEPDMCHLVVIRAVAFESVWEPTGLGMGSGLVAAEAATGCAWLKEMT